MNLGKRYINVILTLDYYGFFNRRKTLLERFLEVAKIFCLKTKIQQVRNWLSFGQDLQKLKKTLLKRNYFVTLTEHYINVFRYFDSQFWKPKNNL